MAVAELTTRPVATSALVMAYTLFVAFNKLVTPGATLVVGSTQFRVGSLTATTVTLAIATSPVLFTLNV